jgi:hypothetical protein
MGIALPRPSDAEIGAGKRGCLWRRPAVMLLAALGFSAALAASGCVFDKRGLPINTYDCEADLWTSGWKNRPMKIAVERPSGASGCYEDVAEFKPAATAIYCGNAYVIKDLGPGLLQGATLITTALEANQSSADPLFSLTFDHQPKALYVAFDGRASSLPGWLTAGYRPVIDPLQGQPYRITITLPDKSQTPAGNSLPMDLFERLAPPLPGETIPFPGPLAEPTPALWPNSVPLENRAMYLVLVKPAELEDWSTAIYGYTERSSFTAIEWGKTADEELADVERKAAECCGNRLYFPPRPQCRDIRCKRLGDYHPPKDQRFDILPDCRSPWAIIRSKADFDPAGSWAEIKLEGIAHRVPIRGELFFDCLHPQRDMRIDGMTLLIDDLAAGPLGRITGQYAHLDGAGEASCAGPAAVAEVPCNAYLLDADRLRCRHGLTRDGELLRFESRNDQPIHIAIDHNQQRFSLQGALNTLLKVDGDDYPIEIALQLTGVFVNFAPTAVSAESTRFSECEENANRAPLLLDASGSGDIYDTLSPWACEWYEDFGTLAQTLWGKGKQVLIFPHQMPFGVHHMTLRVRDNQGVISSSDFTIAVEDSTPPQIDPPADLHVLLSRGETEAVLEIGAAHARDACAPSPPKVANDGPQDGRFAPGLTRVTWEADDGRGKIALAEQQIFVYRPVGSLAEQLGQALAGMQASLASLADRNGQKEGAVHAVSLDPLRRSAARMARVVAEERAAGESVLPWQAPLEQGLDRLEKLLREVAEQAGGDAPGAWRRALQAARREVESLIAALGR